MTPVQVAVSLTAFGFPPRSATALVIEQSTGERVGRTAGIVIAIKRSREERRLAEVRGGCPRCGAQQVFKAGGRFEPGRSFDCPACHGTIALDVPGSLA